MLHFILGKVNGLHSTLAATRRLFILFLHIVLVFLAIMSNRRDNRRPLMPPHRLFRFRNMYGAVIKALSFTLSCKTITMMRLIINNTLVAIVAIPQ